MKEKKMVKTLTEILNKHFQHRGKSCTNNHWNS